MAVLPTKTQPKCKICKSEHRTKIESLLERRSNGESDVDGRRINLEFVLEKLSEWGLENPNEGNVKSHWLKHCEIVTEEDARLVGDELDALNEEMLLILDQSDGSVDGDLRALFKLGMKRIRSRIIKGQDPGVSVDHALKASAELTKRQDNESKRDLLAVLGGGIMAALAQPKQPKQIEGAEVIDAEVVEVP